MEKDSRIRSIWETEAKLLLGRERGSREHPSYQSHLPRGSEGGLRLTSVGARVRERRTEASGQQREPGPRPGTRPALGARGARGGSAPPGLAAPPAAPAVQSPPGSSCRRARGAQPLVPASSPS